MYTLLEPYVGTFTAQLIHSALVLGIILITLIIIFTVIKRLNHRISNGTGKKQLAIQEVLTLDRQRALRVIRWGKSEFLLLSTPTGDHIIDVDAQNQDASTELKNIKTCLTGDPILETSSPAEFTNLPRQKQEPSLFDTPKQVGRPKDGIEDNLP